MATLDKFPDFGGPTQQCVLPLVAKVDDELFPVGTGFIINPNGLFITASHVLEAAAGYAVRRKGANGDYYNHYEFYAIYVSNEPVPDTTHTLGGLLPIDHVWAPIDLDVGFGWLNLPLNENSGEKLRTHQARLRPALPSVGDKIIAFGYYEMTGAICMEDQSVIDYAQNTAIATGKILDVHPVFRDRGLLSFPCFRTDAIFNHGMSGGPIFGESGNVIGVVCSGDTEPGNSYGSLIWPIFGAQIDIAHQPGTEPVKTLIYDLALSGAVLTDDSFKNVRVVTNSDGTRNVTIGKN